jgi:hypothetical protein
MDADERGLKTSSQQPGWRQILGVTTISFGVLSFICDHLRPSAAE